MGVHGLWPLLHPVARPVALETMGGKRLAIDSSIWLYQFQIAMRDKDGRALDNAHILGFLRRICKLLFYGIKPVFVFDGGAPIIKKLAISNRKNRKRGAKETAAKTAEKLLAAQLRAAALAQAQKEAARRETGDVIDAENANYLDEDYGIQPRGAPVRRGTGGNSSSPANAKNTAPSADEVSPSKKRKYVHKDQYALPVIDEPLSSRARPSDPRLATEAELRSFIDDMRPEDFDMDSDFFHGLPTEAKYEIIGDLRIKSRQANHRKVEAMRAAPTPLDFSKAQILGLSHRNDLTQKLLTITDSLSRVKSVTPNRIAGERNKEYVLVKNTASEGAGYILGIREEGHTAAKPVKIENTTSEESDADKTTTDEEFEQVAIPGNGVQRKDSPEAEMRRSMALEAIKQRYSPVKKRRRDDEDESETEAPVKSSPAKLLFNRAAEEDSASDTGGDQLPLPVELLAQIESAVQDADEREDLRRAVEASIKDYEDQGNATKDSDDESDVSFDEVLPQPSMPDSNAANGTPSSEGQNDVPIISASPKRRRPDLIEVVVPARKKAEGQSNGSNAPVSTIPQPAVTTNGKRNAVSSTRTDAETNRLQAKKPPSLRIDVDAVGSVAEQSEPMEQAKPRTPRPDLTAKQAERDTSPQVIREHDGVIERDYAPQQKSPTPPVDERPAETKRASPSSSQQVVQQTAVARPSLLTRTLSNHSDSNLSPTNFVMPDENDLLVYTGSRADDLAVTNATMSVLDENRTTESPNGDDDMQDLDKGDLQAEVREGDVQGHPPALNGNGKGNKEPARTASPEIFYEWSASPEPESRRTSKPIDATLLPPDDPNYIPPDIDFAEEGHELSDLEEEDREHVTNMTSEQREYAKFLSELTNRNLDEMEFEVQNELRVLNEQNKKDKKMADDITQQMAKDIQTMLRVLGLPYVIAPMEAEAQCAELLSRNLVDGVITDDNDVFLFGATRVYKNMFNQNKYVECYLASDIDRELALDRQRLIRLAHFLGSDYCDGLPGVGPVLGMELMAEFPGTNGLVEFRDWWLKVQRGRDTPADHPTAFKRKFKKSKRDIFLDERWPNMEVTKAYLFPSVDSSDEQFAWGIPDLDAMRDFLKDSLGWGSTKVEELLLPIIKRMTGRAAGSAVNQSTIHSFFDVSGGTGRYAPMANKGYQSKRLQAVVNAWRQSQQQQTKKDEDEDGDEMRMSLSESEASDAPTPPQTRKTAIRPISRRNSSARSLSKGSSTSRSRSRSQSALSSRSGNLSDSDDDFHAEIEAKLTGMGIKRKREAPEGSSRVIKRAQKSQRKSGKHGRLLSKKASQSSATQAKGKSTLFAAASDSEDASGED